MRASTVRVSPHPFLHPHLTLRYHGDDDFFVALDLHAIPALHVQTQRSPGVARGTSWGQPCPHSSTVFPVDRCPPSDPFVSLGDSRTTADITTTVNRYSIMPLVVITAEESQAGLASLELEFLALLETRQAPPSKSEPSPGTWG